MKITLDITPRKWLQNSWLFKKKKPEIPKDFWLDLSDGDYQKFKDSAPKQSWLMSSAWLSGCFSVLVSGFFIYAISDFMGYLGVKLFLLFLGFGIGKLFLPVFFIFLIIDFFRHIDFLIARKKHHLVFYERLKKKRR